jgi:ribosome biogenesis GTPase
MSHYERYESVATKKSIVKKEIAKIKSKKLNKLESIDFVIEDDNSCNGVVIETSYNNAIVLYNNENIETILRNDLGLVCNKVLFPGDRVLIEKTNGKYIVTKLLKRKNILSRVRKDGTRINDIGQVQLIAANIDIAAIVVAAKEPPLHPKFIDRYLMIIQSNNITPIIVLNKSDLKTESDEEVLKIYRELGMIVVETSTIDNSGIIELKSLLLGKQAIFVGNSGVGKSSLVNAIMERVDIKTGDIGEKSGRGKHTTTTSKYYIWEDNSSIIDTPGIRSLDVSNYTALEVQNYFKEFDNLSIKCKYKNCLHFKEPVNTCAVKQAFENELINKKRYESYIKLIEELKNK